MLIEFTFHRRETLHFIGASPDQFQQLIDMQSYRQLIQIRFESKKHLPNDPRIEADRLTYRADIAGGSLKVYESRIIADLLLHRLPAAEWKRAIELDNVLQKNSVATAKRQASLIKSRLKRMTPELWALVRDGTKPVATQALFAAAIAHSALLRDFLAYDVRDRFRAGNLALTRNHWRAYVATCLERDPEMSTWAVSTTDKLGDSVFQILTEVGLLSQGAQPVLQPVHYQAEVTAYLKAHGFDEVLRAMQAFL